MSGLWGKKEGRGQRKRRVMLGLRKAESFDTQQEVMAEARIRHKEHDKYTVQATEPVPSVCFCHMIVYTQADLDI